MDTELSTTAIPSAVQTLRAGGLVAYPTETVWGLAALPDRAFTLFERKGRALDHTIQLSCLDAAQALALAEPDPLLTELSACWPGPLTIVARGRADASPPAAQPYLMPKGWLGLRVPDHPLAAALLQQLGTPLATTSCNPSGQPPALNEDQARAYALADFVLTDHTSKPSSALPSTVLQLPERAGGPARLLRAGALSLSTLEQQLARHGIRLKAP